MKKLLRLNKLKVNVLILILSSQFLISCSSVTITGVDPALTASVDKPLLEGKQWRDLATSYVKRGAAIDTCNGRLKLIRSSD